MAVVATPCPEVNSCPTHLVSIDIDVDSLLLHRLWLGIGTGNDTANCRTDEQAHLQGHVTSNVNLCTTGHLCAVGCGGRTISGVNQLCIAVACDGCQRSLLGALILARSKVYPCCIGILIQIVGEVIAFQHLNPCVCRCVHAGLSDNYQQIGLAALRRESGILRVVGHHHIVVTHIMDTGKATNINHSLDTLLAVTPVGEEDTRCARHSQQIGIGSQRVLSQWILLCTGTLLGVVVLYECDSILLVNAIIIAVGYQGPVAVVLLNEFAPVTVVGGIANSIAELEVESCTGLACTFNPVLDSIGAVPAFTNRELWL